jgi:hypothetical protein
MLEIEINKILDGKIEFEENNMPILTQYIYYKIFRYR